MDPRIVLLSDSTFKTTLRNIITFWSLFLLPPSRSFFHDFHLDCCKKEHKRAQTGMTPPWKDREEVVVEKRSERRIKFCFYTASVFSRYHTRSQSKPTNCTNWNASILAYSLNQIFIPWIAFSCHRKL